MLKYNYIRGQKYKSDVGKDVDSARENFIILV